MDNYLGRMLKNWVASSQPNPNGREQLLAIAAGSSKSVRRSRNFELLRGVFLTSNYRGYHEEMLSRPFSQSTVWSFQIVASHRLLA